MDSAKALISGATCHSCHGGILPTLTLIPAIAGATLVDPFTVSGNSLGARDWDGRSSQWYTGSADSGHWEDINCGAHFKSDLNNYLSTAGTKYKNVQVRSPRRYLPAENRA